MDPYKKLNRIKDLRTKKGVTQKEVAKAIGISQGMFTNYETGKRSPRDKEIWEKMAEYFEVPVNYLMGLENAKSQKNETLRNFNLWLRFAQKLWKASDNSFVELINDFLMLNPKSDVLTLDDFIALQKGNTEPSDSIIAAVAHLINVDQRLFRQGNIPSQYERPQMEALLKKAGFSFLKEPAISNLLAALNSAPIVQFSAPDIIQMYTKNLTEENQIKDRVSLVEYLSERRAGLQEATMNDSIPDDIRMDLEVEADSISEELHRLESYTEVFE